MKKILTILSLFISYFLQAQPTTTIDRVAGLRAALNSKLSAVDTLEESGSINWVGNIWRVPGVDSIYFRIHNTTYAIKDSVGSGGSSSSQTLQQVFNTQVGGSVLTKSDTIDVNSRVLRLIGTSGYFESEVEVRAKPSYLSAWTTGFGWTGNGTNAKGSLSFREWSTGAGDDVTITPVDAISSSYTLYIPEGNNGDTIATKAYARSIAGGGGTVTSVATGNGLTGGPVTTTGTLKADTLILSTLYNRQKGLDSLAALIPSVSGKLNISDTASMLSVYLRGATAGYGINISGSQHKTWTADTLLLTSLYNRQKLADSLAAIINTKGTGSVTSVATGYGLSGGTITTSGTLIADSLSLSSRYWRQKGLDSLAALIPSVSGKLNISDTASMLSVYLRGSTEGWGINISGSQHKTWTVDSLEASSWYRLYKVSDSLSNNNIFWRTTGNTGTVAATNFIGTIDDIDLVFKRFNTKSGLIGGSNTGFGYGAGAALAVGGTNNTFFGVSAGAAVTTGDYNIAIGVAAGAGNTVLSYNTGIGGNALRYLTNVGTGANTAVGHDAMGLATRASENAAFGLDAGYNLTTGNGNTFIGTYAGHKYGSGNDPDSLIDNSVFLGYDARAAANGQTNQIVIGHTAVGFGSNTAVLGNSSITQTMLRGLVGIGMTSQVAQLDITVAASTVGLNMIGTAAADNPSGAGAAASNILTIVGPAGQSSSSGTSSTPGGAGSAISLTTGAGGAKTASATLSPGGTGGAFSINGGTGGGYSGGSNNVAAGVGAAVSITGGNGGAQTGTGSGSGSNGGAGGALTFTTGTGGAASGSGSIQKGGAGGIANFNAGSGGASTQNNGGLGGAFAFQGGAGGISTRTGGGTSGNGGGFTMTAGAGGANTISGGTAGNGGDIGLQAGAAGAASGGASAGVNGVINIGTSVAKTITIGNTTDNTAVTFQGTGTVAIGTLTATTINKLTLTSPATGSTLTIADGKTLTVSNSITLAGTDATTMTLPTTNATIARTDAGQTFTGGNTFATATLFTAASPAISTYNNIATAGAGMTFIVASAATGSVSSTQTNLINYTPPAAAGRYRLCYTIANTAGTNTGTTTPTITYRDAAGIAKSYTIASLQEASATLLIAATGASKNFSQCVYFSINNAATAITITFTISGTVATFISVTLEQVA